MYESLYFILYHNPETQESVFFSTPISAYDCSDKLGYEKQFSFFYVIEDWQE